MAFGAFLNLRNAHYATQRRWPPESFWSRRHEESGSWLVNSEVVAAADVTRWVPLPPNPVSGRLIGGSSWILSGGPWGSVDGIEEFVRHWCFRVIVRNLGK